MLGSKEFRDGYTLDFGRMRLDLVEPDCFSSDLIFSSSLFLLNRE